MTGQMHSGSLINQPPPKAQPFVFGGCPILPSALPWYAVNDKDPHDSVYTKRRIAERCFSTFKATAKKHGYDLRVHIFLEPSAGEGCFYDLLPPRRRLALDIAPARKEIQRANFLEWSPPRPGRYAVVGNPPFGVRGALALAFINRTARFADIVGFILPMTFASDGKGGAMTRVQGLNLLHSEELPPNSFYHAASGDDADSDERDINTVFQVWGARPTAESVSPPTCDSFAEIYTVCTNPDRRCGLVRLAKGEYDFFIQGTFYDNRPPKVVRDFAEVKYNSGYGIIIKQKKIEIARALKNADWLRHSSRSTNHCRHIRIAHIRAALTEAGFKDKR